MDLRDRRELNRGLGDTLSVAFEFAATTGICVGLGWWIDGKANTRPLFIIVLAVVSLVAQSAKLWFAYDAEMRRHEQALPSAAKRNAAPDADPVTP